MTGLNLHLVMSLACWSDVCRRCDDSQCACLCHTRREGEFWCVSCGIYHVPPLHSDCGPEGPYLPPGGER